MLLAKNGVFDRYQIVQLYMALGGIPYYIDAIQPHLSAAQNIQELLFDKVGLLKNESSFKSPPISLVASAAGRLKFENKTRLFQAVENQI